MATYRHAKVPDAVSSSWPGVRTLLLLRFALGGAVHGLAQTFDLHFYWFNHRRLLTSEEKGLKTVRASRCFGMTSWTSAWRDFRSSMVYLSLTLS